MNICSHCASPFEANQPTDRHPTCPYCGTKIVNHQRSPWVDVARVTSLAEAGFLTDELVGLGIEAQIYQLEEFGGSSHRWDAAYLIRVPTGMAQDAAARIREHLAEDAAGGERGPRNFCFSADSAAIDPAFWRPVALLILAGVASFALGQQFPEHPPRNRVSDDSLPKAIDAIGRPLVTEPAAGLPRYRLSFDRRREAWSLGCDRDGDGLFESQQQFHASGASW